MNFAKIVTNLLPVLLFFSCSKDPFAHVEVHGKIISSQTNQPLQAEVQLWVGAGMPGDKGTTDFASVRTNTDGSFDIKTKAQWSGADYQLNIIPDSIEKYSSITKSIDIPKHKNIDVGSIGL